MSTNLWQGLTLMLVGMGTVFAFLTLLVLATAVMSRAVMRWEGVRAGASGAEADGPADEEVAAITAAVAEHRRRTG